MLFLAPLSVLTDIRDVVIVIAGIIAVAGGLLFLVMTGLIGFLTIRLLRSVRKTVGDGVPPILSQAEETVKTVRGTADFLSEQVAEPVIRVYSVASRVRRMAEVLTRRRGG